MSRFAAKVIRHLRRRFIDAPRGLGHPVPPAAFDQEYASGHWDLLFTEAELPRYNVLLEFILAASPHPSVLDIGCGNGRLAQLLAPHTPRRYVGLDLSPEGLRRARALALPDCEWIEGDFEYWRPAPGETFDAVVFNESIGYATDPRAALAAFAPLVRPSGTLLVSYFRSGNYRALWRRVVRQFPVRSERCVRNDRGQVWDIRALQTARASTPLSRRPHP